MSPTLQWLLNIVGWPVIHLSVSYWALRREVEDFTPQSFLFRERRWERGGFIYEKYFCVRRWKRHLPDGAGLLGFSFRKKRLQSFNKSYLQRFALETCRAEWVHWLTLMCTPLFFLYNPLWADLVMIFYALAANVPCLIVQRYNRIILNRLLTTKSKSRCP